MGLNYNPAAVIQGLVMYMDITNTRSYSGSGNTIYNLANGGIAGTIVSGISYDTDNRKNLNFNGSSGYMFSNNTSMDFSTSDFTIQTTVKLNGLSNGFSNAYGSVICAGAALTNNSSILQFVGTATSHYAIGLWHQPTSTTIGRNYNFQTNKIYNIAVVKNTTQVEFFVDGASIGTTSSSNFFNFTANGFAIGRWYFPGYEQYLKGNIYELKAYSRALSNEEIAQNYNATRGRFTTPENIVKTGLILNLDPSNSNSYAGFGNTIYDLSGFGGTGTLTNGPTFSSLNGGAIVFDGTNDQISTADIDLSSTDKVTVSCWVKVLNYREVYASSNIVFEFSSNFNNNIGSFVAAFADGSPQYSSIYPIALGIRGNSGYSLVGYSKTLVNDLSWHHWTCIFDTSLSGNENTLYIDGVSRAAISTPYLSDNSGNFGNFKLFIGNRDTSSIAANANISQVQIYNRALTQQEILQNFNATRFRYGI